MGVVVHAASVYCSNWRKPLNTGTMEPVGSEVGAMEIVVGFCEGAALAV